MSDPASIAGVIAAEGGEVTFARFMELALTHPTLGYYSRADRLLRYGGDFSTAPALSPFFNRTLARLVTELVDASLLAHETGAAAPQPCSVIELGGGEGHLMAAILEVWDEERPDLRERLAYRVVEVGARLRARQAEATAHLIARGWDVGWGTTVKEAAAGTRPVVIVGNEFVDALPVHLVRIDDGAIVEAYVRAEPNGRLEWSWGPLSGEAVAEIELLFGCIDPGRLAPLTVDGVLQFVPGLGSMLEQVAHVMPAGSLVNIDYGEWLPGIAKAGERWGLEDRVLRRCTARGYFKHQLVSDLLSRAGSQDLTADVDFAALDLHGRRHGFETVLFTTLGAFLRAGGAEAEIEALDSNGQAADTLEADRQATVLRGLLDERDLGGAFKVMVQVRE